MHKYTQAPGLCMERFGIQKVFGMHNKPGVPVDDPSGVASAITVIEPGTGEINYPFLFAELRRLNYRGYVEQAVRLQPDHADSKIALENLVAAGGAP